MKKAVFAVVVMVMLMGTIVIADDKPVVTNIVATQTVSVATNLTTSFDNVGNTKVDRTEVHNIKTLTFTWDGETFVLTHKALKDATEKIYAQKWELTAEIVATP